MSVENDIASTKIIAAIIVVLSACSNAFAENCRAIPLGPERRACAMREHPAMFEAKLDRCLQIARQRGDTYRTGTGAGRMKDFVQDCMQGKQR